MKIVAVPFWLAFPAAGLIAALFAAGFGFFCVRLTKIYFAMLTLAFSQIVWAVCFKWNDLTGGDQGLPDVPFPDLGWMAALPGFDRMRIAEQFYVLALVLVALSVAAQPADLRRRRPHADAAAALERAAFIGVNVRL